MYVCVYIQTRTFKLDGVKRLRLHLEKDEHIITDCRMAVLHMLANNARVNIELILASVYIWLKYTWQVTLAYRPVVYGHKIITSC
jgi:hypothetical protein